MQIPILASRPLSFHQGVFWIAAAYDIALGLGFMFFHEPILDALDITPPDNTSYIHLSAVFVLVQGLTYILLARNLRPNADLVKAGMLYKAGYFLVALYYLVTDDLLHWVFFLFGVADLIFLVLFLGALAAIRTAEQRGAR